jgi:hypothetical protein
VNVKPGTASFVLTSTVMVAVTLGPQLPLPLLRVAVYSVSLGVIGLGVFSVFWCAWMLWHLSQDLRSHQERGTRPRTGTRPLHPGDEATRFSSRKHSLEASWAIEQEREDIMAKVEVNLPDEVAAELERIAVELGISMAELFAQVAKGLTEADAVLRQHGSRLTQHRKLIVDWSLSALDVDVIPRLDAWQGDKPFPLSDEQCIALARGHDVRWRGTFEEFCALPGCWELIEGYLHARR